MCLLECEKYVMCLFLNYNLKYFVCELNSGWKIEFFFWISDDEYVYYEIFCFVSVLQICYCIYIMYIVFFYYYV